MNQTTSEDSVLLVSVPNPPKTIEPPWILAGLNLMRLEVLVSFNMVGGPHESESRMVATPTRREHFPCYAGDFVFLGVGWIMGDTINPRVLDFVARFINISHCNLLFWGRGESEDSKRSGATKM